MYSNLFRFLSPITSSAASGGPRLPTRHTRCVSQFFRSIAQKTLPGFRRFGIVRAMSLLGSCPAHIFHRPPSSLLTRTDATTASELSDLVKQYRQLCHEIEWLKCRIVGARSYPIDSRRWKAWKSRQARQKHLDADRTPLAELSDDPHYQRLVRLHAYLLDVQHDMQGFEASYSVEQNFINQVVFSFPSLKKRLLPFYDEIDFEQILWDGQTADPQAYFAAVFVRTLQRFVSCGYESTLTFFIDQAFEVWDDEHKTVFAHWITLPYFPYHAFRTLSVNPPSV